MESKLDSYSDQFHMAKDLVEHQLYPSTPAANMNKANALACGCTIYSGRQIRK